MCKFVVSIPARLGYEYEFRLHLAPPPAPALPANRSYAVKYIYAGPHEADLLSPDMCINILLTLMGFFPGGSAALVNKLSAVAMAVSTWFGAWCRHTGHLGTVNVPLAG